MLFTCKYRCKTQCLSKEMGLGAFIPCWRRSQLLQTPKQMPAFNHVCNDTWNTWPCNLYPLETYFHIAKLGYAGVYLFFLIFATKHRLWVLVRTAPALKCILSDHTLCFEQKYEKYQKLSTENFNFLKLQKNLFIAE